MSKVQDAKFGTSHEKKAALETAHKEAQETAAVARTEYFEFRNTSTKYDVKIALAQGVEGMPGAGYVDKTGLVTTAVELPPGQTQRGNVDPSINCKATRATCSIIWRWRPTGYEGTKDMKDYRPPAGQYVRFAFWSIVDPHSAVADAKTPPEPVILLHTDGGVAVGNG